eukprot:9368990-Pyramimonas_sp.AAC.1
MSCARCFGPHLRRLLVPLEHARRQSVDGCLDIAVPTCNPKPSFHVVEALLGLRCRPDDLSKHFECGVS